MNVRVYSPPYGSILLCLRRFSVCRRVRGHESRQHALDRLYPSMYSMTIVVKGEGQEEQGAGSKEQEKECGKAEKSISRRMTGRALYFPDPDGITLEIIAPRERPA